MEKSLVVFVHGLDADDEDWWGSTESSLRNNPPLTEKYDIRFFSYKTDKIKTILNDVENGIGLGEVQPLLGDIGAQLSTYLKHECKNGNHSSIKLFGHSMGGLVIGASLQTLEEHHRDIYDNISSIAFAGTPLGGSSVASVLKRFLGFIVSSQTKSISINAAELLKITNPLPNYLTIDKKLTTKIKKHLIFFRIGEDEVVSNDEERYGVFIENRRNLKPHEYTLTGKHSESVQNLAANSANFEEIYDWIMKNERFMDFSITNSSQKPKTTFKTQEKKNRSYLVLERYVSKTYLQNELIIQDLNETIKVTDTNECIIEFYHGFYKDVQHLANIKYLSKLKKNLIKRNKKLTARSYKNNTKIKIDRFKYPIFLGQKIINNCITNIEIDKNDIYFKETDKSMGLNFKFNLGQYPIDTIIDFKFSFTLPTDIYHTKRPDTFRFKTAANLTKIIIQEEIYGNSSHKFEVRWKRNNTPCMIQEPIVNLYYRTHYGEFKYERKEDFYEVVVERK